MKNKEKVKFKDSKVFGFIKDKFPDIAGKGLELFGEITGKEGFASAGRWLQGEKNLNTNDSEELKIAMDHDLKELEIIESNLTERHKNDMLSDSWLSKNVRPIVVLNFTALIDYVILSAIHGRPIKEQFLGLIMTLGVSTIGGYFVMRTTEKRNKNKYNE